MIPPSDAPEPVSFGAAETDGTYRVLAGTIPPGRPASRDYRFQAPWHYGVRSQI